MLQTDLAAVLSRSLRLGSSGDRGDSAFEAAGGAAALCRLVEHHAHEIVGLPPDYNIGHLFEELGEQTGFRRSTAAHHRDHVLAMYLAGHFLLSLALDSGHPQRLAQAYSLAALFHDVGHLLFPERSAVREGIEWDDPEIAAALQKVQSSLDQEGSEVTRRCLEDLGFAYYTAAELARWRDRLGTREPSHGLVGAWYLHRVGLRVIEHCPASGGSREAQTAVLRMAVRAVLLHGAAAGPLRVENEPTARLLGVCNELFPWAPETWGRSSSS